MILSAVWLATSAVVLAGDSASGTISFKGGKGVIKYGFLVRGPDEMDPSKTVLRLYLSSADIGAKIKACKTLSCADNALSDGAMVDFADVGGAGQHGSGGGDSNPQKLHRRKLIASQACLELTSAGTGRRARSGTPA